MNTTDHFLRGFIKAAASMIPPIGAPNPQMQPSAPAPMAAPQPTQPPQGQPAGSPVSPMVAAMTPKPALPVPPSVVKPQWMA